MKMSNEHYKAISDAITSLAAKYNADEPSGWTLATDATRRSFAANPKIKDVEKALRWKIYHVALTDAAIIGRLTSELYTYLNDDHIDTALRKLMIDHKVTTQ